MSKVPLGKEILEDGLDSLMLGTVSDVAEDASHRSRRDDDSGVITFQCHVAILRSGRTPAPGESNDTILMPKGSGQEVFRAILSHATSDCATRNFHDVIKCEAPIATKAVKLRRKPIEKRVRFNIGELVFVNPLKQNARDQLARASNNDIK